MKHNISSMNGAQKRIKEKKLDKNVTKERASESTEEEQIKFPYL
jgi:hypothetical protein